MSDQKRQIYLRAVCDEQQRKRKRLRGKQACPQIAMDTGLRPGQHPPQALRERDQLRIEEMPATKRTRREIPFDPKKVKPATTVPRKQCTVRQALRLVNLGGLGA